MSEKPLKTVIIEKAGELFREQGYAATSIKQIATASGCTNAALYYYYEGGKQQILREVIHSTATQNMAFLAVAETAVNLESFLVQLTEKMNATMPEMTHRVNWLLLQFPTLPEAEQRFLQNQLIAIHDRLQAELGHFVADEALANRLAWLIFCALFGYRQVFATIGVGQQIADLSLADFGRFLAQSLANSLSQDS